jgi:hypothetical protein
MASHREAVEDVKQGSLAGTVSGDELSLTGDGPWNIEIYLDVQC